MNITCRTCDVQKDESEFSKDSSHKSGRRIHCKVCLESKSLLLREELKDLPKICPQCDQIKRRSEFFSHPNTKDGYTKLCKDCKNSNTRKRQSQWTTPEYNAQYIKQGGACAICEKMYPVLHSDHDHETLEKRELLCFNCNSSLGGFQDDLDTLRRALKYLERFKLKSPDER